MMQVFRIDNNGFYIEPVIVQDTEPVPIDCVTVIPPNGLFKPQLVNGNWVEGEDSNTILSIIKNAKISSLDDSCNKTILGNFEYVVNGVTYYFPNDETAQKNFDKFYIAFKDGIASSPENFTCYDVNGKVCRVGFDETTFPDLYKAHLNHIAGSVAKFRDYLEPQVNAITVQNGDLQTAINQVNAITW